MFSNYDVEKLKKVLCDFSSATKININFIDADLTHTAICEISHNKYCAKIQSSPGGVQRCRCSDTELMLLAKKTKSPTLHVCHAGLTDIAVPIFQGEILLGYIILGQMKTEEDFKDAGERIRSLHTDTSEMKEYYDGLPIYTKESVEGVTAIAEMLAKYVIFENMFSTNFDATTASVLAFIDTHLFEHLSVRDISKNTCVSKTTLYKIFRTNFNSTVNEYINKRRVEESVNILLRGNESIEEISLRVGFTSAAYYTKVFRKYNGISPLKFKKLHKKTV